MPGFGSGGLNAKRFRTPASNVNGSSGSGCGSAAPTTWHPSEAATADLFSGLQGR